MSVSEAEEQEMIRFDCPGNLINDPAEALVNTVNEVGVSGKGVALAFKHAFPENFRAYREQCLGGRIVAGGLMTFARDGFLPPKYVFNMATKKHWRDPSRLEWIELGLSALRREVSRLRITSIAMPLPGCGNGGLLQDDVREKISRLMSSIEVFDHDCHFLQHVSVRVYGSVA